MQNGSPERYDPKTKAKARRGRLRRDISANQLALAAVGTLWLVVAIGRAVVTPVPASPPPAQPVANKAEQQAATLPAMPNVPNSPAAPLLQEAVPSAVQERLSRAMAARADRAMRIVPIYRGVGRVETFPQFSNANRLLLATHNRLMWYRFDTGEVQVVHEGQGVYYGVFPGDDRDLLAAPTSLWVVSRPHDWHPTTTREWLLHLHMESGQELGRVALPSRFTHDAVRRRDKVYICSTGEGRVEQLRFPGLELERELALFSSQEHINTLAPTADNKLWVLQHNLGASALALVNLEDGRVERRVEGVGTKAHGLVLWDRYLLLLDSEAGALVRVGTETGAVEQVWKAEAQPSHFLKGLCVIDDIAYFGVAPVASRKHRADPALSCELAAFDLRENVLLWRRSLPTQGLLNVVAAPHLVVESTSYSINLSPQISYRASAAYAAAIEAARQQQQQQTVVQQAQQGQEEQRQAAGVARRALIEIKPSETPAGAGITAALPWQTDSARWSSGLPRLRLGLASSGSLAAGQAGGASQQQQQQQQQQQHSGTAAHAGAPSTRGSAPGQHAGVQLMLAKLDVAQLRDAALALPEREWTEEWQRRENAWLEGREGNLQLVKPGTKAILLVFSDREGEAVYRFPAYRRFAALVEPLLEQVLGRRDMQNIMRLQLARMPPHSEIRRHRDSGGYASRGHRIHVVLATSPRVRFWVCPQEGGQGEQQAADAWAGRAAAASIRLQRQQHMQRAMQGSQPPASRAQEGLAGCLQLRTEEGLAFELNNRLAHAVVNDWDRPRIHLVVDVAEQPRQQTELRVGVVCRYQHGRIVCDRAPVDSPKADRVDTA